MLQGNAPAGFKTGKLIASKYRAIDLIISSALFIASFISIIFYYSSSKDPDVTFGLIAIIPSLLGLLLIQPIGIYHNVFVFIIIIIKYLIKVKKYMWEGVIKDE